MSAEPVYSNGIVVGAITAETRSMESSVDTHLKQLAIGDLEMRSLRCSSRISVRAWTGLVITNVACTVGHSHHVLLLVIPLRTEREV